MSDRLERRYRRLLALYPAEHRRAYQDEMLGVLLAGARPGQRLPGLRDTLDLLRAAVTVRLRQTRLGPLDAQWGDAAAVAGVLVPMLLLAAHLGNTVHDFLWSRDLGLAVSTVSTSDWLPGVTWLLVTAAALAGWRSVAAVLAWAAVAGHAMLLAAYLAAPTNARYAFCLLVLALTAAAALSVPSEHRRGAAILGWRRSALFAGGTLVAALVVAADAISQYLWRIDRYIPVAEELGYGLVAPALVVAAAVLMLAAIARIAAPIRRRVLVLLAPATALLVVSALLGDGYAATVSGGWLIPPVVEGIRLWLVLVATPVVVLLAGVALVRRRERWLHLVQLGEAMERQLRASAARAADDRPDGDPAG